MDTTHDKMYCAHGGLISQKKHINKLENGTVMTECIRFVRDNGPGGSGGSRGED